MLRSELLSARRAMGLSGSELLQAVEQCRGLSRSEIVKRCGYVSVTESGQERLNNTAFYEALLEAKGFALGNGRRGSADRRRGRRSPRSGRTLPFHTKVQFNGNLMVGRAYLELLEAKPGDHFVIRLGRQGIRLLPLDADAADDGLEAR